METLKEIWSYVWSKLVSFGKLLKKWFTEEEVIVPEVTKLVKEEKKETKIRLRKKTKKLSKSKK